MVEVAVTKIEREVERRRPAIRPVNERISKLRELTVNKPVQLSIERAKLLTEFYKSNLP